MWLCELDVALAVDWNINLKLSKKKILAARSTTYYKAVLSIIHIHTGKCIRRFAGIYAYCRYFIDRK